MSDLSPELQQLVVAGRTTCRPTDADCTRIFKSLDARLGIGVGMGGDAATAAVTKSAVRSLVAKAVGISVAGLALVVGGVGVSTVVQTAGPGSEPSAARALAVSSSHHASLAGSPAPSSAGPAVEGQSPTIPVALGSSQSRSVAPASSRGSSRSRDNLSEEVAIIGRAETELHSGRAENALSLLNEHERRFGNGILAEERTAAQILALCALGRAADANAQLARLSPTSLHGQQARRACGSTTQESGQQPAGRKSTGSPANKR